MKGFKGFRQSLALGDLQMADSTFIQNAVERYGNDVYGCNDKFTEDADYYDVNVVLENELNNSEL